MDFSALDTEQKEKLDTTLQAFYEYKVLARDNTASANELISNLIDDFIPKIEKGTKASRADKENNKQERKEAKQTIGDIVREFMREKDSKPDTTPEARQAYENLKNK